MPRKSYPLKLNFDIYYRKSDEKWCEYREISKAHWRLLLGKEACSDCKGIAVRIAKGGLQLLALDPNVCGGSLAFL